MIHLSVCAKINFDTFTQNLQLLYTIYRKIDSSVWLVDLEMHSYLSFTRESYIFTIYTFALMGTPRIILSHFTWSFGQFPDCGGVNKWLSKLCIYQIFIFLCSHYIWCLAVN